MIGFNNQKLLLSKLDIIQRDDSDDALVVRAGKPATGDSQKPVRLRVDKDGVVTLSTVNAVRYADQFAGADASAKIKAAVLDLPATGGTVDALGLEGAQTISAQIILSKPVTLRLGHSTYTVANGVTSPAIDCRAPCRISMAQSSRFTDTSGNVRGSGGTRIVAGVGYTGYLLGVTNVAPLDQFNAAWSILEGGVLDGNARAASGVRIQSTFGVTVRNMVIDDADVGVQLLNTGASQNWTEGLRLEQLYIEDPNTGIEGRNNGGTTSLGHSRWDQIIINLVRNNSKGIAFVNQLGGLPFPYASHVSRVTIYGSDALGAATITGIDLPASVGTGSLWENIYFEITGNPGFVGWRAADSVLFPYIIQTHLAGTGTLYSANVVANPQILNLYGQLAPRTVNASGAPVYSFYNDSDTGMYSTGADQIAWSTAGARRMWLDTILRGPDGTAAAPGFTFDADSTTGVFRVGAGQLGLAGNSKEVVRITALANAAEFLTVEATPAATGRVRLTAGPTAGDWLNLRGQGAAGFAVLGNTAQEDAFRAAGVTSGVNGLEVFGAVTTATPFVRAFGNDANISLNLIPKGTGNVGIDSTTPSTRLAISGSGAANGITLGDGAANSVNLYRSAADVLFTDDDLQSAQNLGFKSGTAFLGTLDHAITAARTWILPDAAGTVALTTAPGTTGTDVNWSAAGQLNVPDASATARGAVTTLAQTFAGSKTFNDILLAAGNARLSAATGTLQFGAGAVEFIERGTDASLRFATANAYKFVLVGADHRLVSNAILGWSSGDPTLTTIDTNLYRSAADTLFTDDDLQTAQNLHFKSGTAFLGTLDHAITAARTWTLPNAASNVAGSIARNTTAVATGVAVVETDLQTYTLPANTMGATGVVRISAAGTVTGVADVKTIKLYFGSALLATVSEVAGATNDWSFTAVILNAGVTNSQKVRVVAYEGNAIEIQDYLTAAIDTTAAVVIKTTGTTPNAGDDVSSEVLLVEIL